MSKRRRKIKVCMWCGFRKRYGFYEGPGGWVCVETVSCKARRGPACAAPEPDGGLDACRRAVGHRGKHVGLSRAWSA